MEVHARNHYFALLIQPFTTRQTSLAESKCSLLCCEIKLPKVERKEVNVING